MGSMILQQSPSFYLAKLEICDIGQIMTLQEKVLASLKKGEETFLIKRSEEEMAENLVEPHHTIGFFDAVTHQLVSAGCLRDDPPQTLSNGLTGQKMTSILPDDGDASGVITAIMVDPAYAGNKLMASMLIVLDYEARNHGYKSLMARSVATNSTSIGNFARAGFVTVGTAIKPTDHLGRVFLYKNLCPLRKNTSLLPALQAEEMAL